MTFDLPELKTLANNIDRDDQRFTLPATFSWPEHTTHASQGYYVCSRCQRQFRDIQAKQTHRCRRAS